MYATSNLLFSFLFSLLFSVNESGALHRLGSAIELYGHFFFFYFFISLFLLVFGEDGGYMIFPKRPKYKLW